MKKFTYYSVFVLLAILIIAGLFYSGMLMYQKFLSSESEDTQKCSNHIPGITTFDKVHGIPVFAEDERAACQAEFSTNHDTTQPTEKPSESLTADVNDSTVQKTYDVHYSYESTVDNKIRKMLPIFAAVITGEDFGIGHERIGDQHGPEFWNCMTYYANFASENTGRIEDDRIVLNYGEFSDAIIAMNAELDPNYHLPPFIDLTFSNGLMPDIQFHNDELYFPIIHIEDCSFNITDIDYHSDGSIDVGISHNDGNSLTDYVITLVVNDSSEMVNNTYSYAILSVLEE